MDKVEYVGLNNLLARAPRTPLDEDDRRWLLYAKQLTHKSPVPRWAMAAVIARGDDLVVQSTNITGTHPFQSRYNRLTTHTHAEMMCLIKSRPADLINKTIYIQRHKRDGMDSCTYPCVHCMNAILTTRLRFICCVDEQHRPVKIDIKQLV